MASEKPTVVRINVSDIQREPGLQAREEIDPATVRDYAEIYREGGPESLPPLDVYQDNDAVIWLADGNHRVEAAALAGMKNLPAIIRNGTRRDAVLHAAGANASHGLRRTNADKRRAVKLLLADPEWASASDRRIGEKCRVSHVFVGKVRSETTGNVSSSRIGRDGKVRDVPAKPLYDLEATLSGAEKIEKLAQYAEKRVEELQQLRGSRGMQWLGDEMDELLKKLQSVADGIRSTKHGAACPVCTSTINPRCETCRGNGWIPLRLLNAG